ncbi:hypothetical protein MRQ36_23075 [Micromonospora sp. R77]|uniref:hypothetical protein n=1 Tax=Micromonospora sp. R77 TaxID=2925836 RepID=UPI001F60C718|nr:hypothetical protein [Micromonospora sp. R77]MCI4065292.1 hypothetical protein [Micromonospora sp. R77]
MVSVTRRAALVLAGAALAVPLLGMRPALAAEPAPGPPPGGEQGQLPSDLIFVEVTPSTVQPGYLVGIRASCRDNSIPAIVVSDAFGRVQVQPQRGLLTASPMVRERTRPGNYRVKLECPSGQTASTMLQVVKGMSPTPTHAPPTRVPPSRGPATGFGGTADGPGLGGLLVPGGLGLTLAGAVVGLMAIRRPGAARR